MMRRSSPAPSGARSVSLGVDSASVSRPQEGLSCLGTTVDRARGLWVEAATECSWEESGLK